MATITPSTRPALAAQIRVLRARVARLERAERQRTRRHRHAQDADEAVPTISAEHYRRVLAWDYPCPGFEG